MIKPKVIFLVGPTCVGKSLSAIVLARRIKAEIISLDSMQIYKGIDIISSKPSVKQMGGIAHHLMDFLSPGRSFNVSQYRRMAVRHIKDIHSRGKLPLFVGGTGLYMSILLDGLFKDPCPGAEIRLKLLKQAKGKPADFLFNRLKKVDPEAAARIHPNDLRRVIRALEVFEKTGKPISVWQKERKGICAKYDARVIGLNMERDILYERINKRVDAMLKEGLIQEAQRLLGGRLSKTAASAIGISEIKKYLLGEISMDEALELMKMNTRRYAKRQMTYFRKDKRVEWVGVDGGDNAADVAGKILKIIQRFI